MTDAVLELREADEISVKQGKKDEGVVYITQTAGFDAALQQRLVDAMFHMMKKLPPQLKTTGVYVLDATRRGHWTWQFQPAEFYTADMFKINVLTELGVVMYKGPGIPGGNLEAFAYHSADTKRLVETLEKLSMVV